MKNGFEDLCYALHSKCSYFSILFLCFLKKRKSLTLFTPCMLINMDNLSIQQKYSFIEDVKLNKSGNVSESPPIGYGDCATHLSNSRHSYSSLGAASGVNGLKIPS